VTLGTKKFSSRNLSSIANELRVYDFILKEKLFVSFSQVNCRNKIFSFTYKGKKKHKNMATFYPLGFGSMSIPDAYTLRCFELSVSDVYFLL
jgi:hypothetical protein